MRFEKSCSNGAYAFNHTIIYAKYERIKSSYKAYAAGTKRFWEEEKQPKINHVLGDTFLDTVTMEEYQERIHTHTNDTKNKSK